MSKWERRMNQARAETERRARSSAIEVLHAPDGIAALSYEELLARLEKTRQQLDSWTFNDRRQRLEEHRAVAALIRTELHRRGGKPLMLKAHADSGAARSVEIAWDGIGEWRD